MTRCWLFAAAISLLGNSAHAERPTLVRLTHDGHLKQRPAWSPDGASLTFTRHQGSTIFLFLRSANGKDERRLTKTDGPEYDATWSPDGKRLAFSFDKVAPNQGDIDVHSIGQDGEAQQPVFVSSGKLTHEEWPSWSPDGHWIALTSTREDNQDVYLVRPDGSEPRRLTSDPAIDAHPAWSPDGQRLAFSTNRWGDLELATVQPDGTGLTRLTESRGLDDYPTWSPDGRRIAFTSNRDGNLEIYSIDAHGQNLRNETQHAAIDNFPAWSPRGELTFVSNRDDGFEIYMFTQPAEVKP